MGDVKATILVAQPDPLVQEVLARVVEAAGHDAVRLDAGADVAAAATHSEADAIVLDLGAANLDALHAVRGPSPDVAPGPVVVVIGTGPAGGRLAWQAGADGFLVRPFHARELQAAVDEALGLDPAQRAARRSAAADALAS